MKRDDFPTQEFLDKVMNGAYCMNELLDEEEAIDYIKMELEQWPELIASEIHRFRTETPTGGSLRLE